MNKKRIVILMGKSSTGKTTILKELVDNYGFHNMISLTTRDKRPGETESDYTFLKSNEEFDSIFENQGLLEKTEYIVDGKRWCYGLPKSSISKEKDNVVILNPDGVRQLLDSEYKDNLDIYHFDCDTDLIIQRYFGRSEKTDKSKIQLVDRLLRDLEDFQDSNIRKLKSRVSMKKWHSIKTDFLTIEQIASYVNMPHYEDKNNDKV
jgi:guanylate kinase